MRFWLLKMVARLLGLKVQMIAFQHITPPSVAARVMAFPDWFDYWRARDGALGAREVKCVVFATDPLAAVEMFHSANHGIALDGTVRDATVQ